MRHELPLLLLALVLLALGFGVLGGAWAFPSADVPMAPPAGPRSTG